MTRLYVDGPTVMRAVAAAVANLEAHVAEVDGLNVFPVPDGDTGSNMLATMRAALAEAERLPPAERHLQGVAEALSRGALSGARGNSGVILSQIIRGMTQGADGRRRVNGVHLATGLRRGSEVAYGAVLSPVEGTILTVIRDAATAAEAAAGRRPHVEAVLAEVIAAAASSVERTPMLLPLLEEAGVVDSGGQGLYRLLEGTLQVPGGSVAPASPSPSVLGGRRRTHLPAASLREVAHRHATAAHGYETEYLLTSREGSIDIEALRAAILECGDSVVVAGDDRLARVHVHGERPDLAVAAGLAWGRLSEVAIRDLDEQVAEAAGPVDPPAPPAASSRRSAPEVGGHDGPAPALASRRRAPPVGSPHRAPPVASPSPAPPAVAAVAVAQSDGLAEVLASLGAYVVRPAHGTRPSVGEIGEVMLATGASDVVVLPNDRDALMVAERAAALMTSVLAEVIPTRNVAEGIAAVVAFDPTASLSRNRERMAAEAASLRSFAVITAARDAVVDGRTVRQGQIIALDADRRLLAQAASVEEAAFSALAGLGRFELVTCYAGADARREEVAVLRRRIEEAGWDAQVEVIPGGQRFEHLIVAVE
jgi:hypothetical protein